ncbi:YfcE family phosphodiesterase [Desulfoluna sp.]|uniref:YfcE family phosphodiesterase n=1 Tax=Desulfoluna sp. TaxID=2045199 RepID=UPI0026260B37|nr:YfcE family phosphodiesterase [Desulfoluna sp.]
MTHSLIITADIHGHLPTWRLIKAQLKPGDGLAVAGDLFDTVYGRAHPEFDPFTIREEFQALANPTWYVCGNCDQPDFYSGELSLAFSWEEKTLLLAHGHSHLPDLTDYDIVIQGHTHVSQLDTLMGKVFLNPGSPVIPRGGHQGFARLSDNRLELVELPGGRVVEQLDLTTTLTPR